MEESGAQPTHPTTARHEGTSIEADRPTASTAEPTGVDRWIPGLRLVRSYTRSSLRPDLIAGLVVTALLVPQGMAYAELAGLPPVTGLYTTVMALLAYAVFGPSRVLILGPDSSLGPLIFATIIPLVGADGDPARAIALAGMLAILMGLVCIGAGLARLGSIAELLSRPVRIGYLNGIALIVLVSQLPKLFGFSTDADGFVPEIRAFVSGVIDGETNRAALLIGVTCLAVILALKRVAPAVPGVLIAVGGATIVTAAFGLGATYGLSVVGSIPQGFPVPSFPRVGLSDLPALAAAAVGMAFVTLADTTALSRSFALKYNDDVDPNQEILALGAANVSAGLFQGFPVSASASRTAVADTAGGRSQVVGVVGAISIVLLLLFANDLVKDMPSASLAAVVIAASFSLFDLAATRELWRMRRSEFVLCMAALLGVTLIGVLAGIVVAVALSMGDFVRRSWRPYNVELGIVPGRVGLHDVDRHPDGTTVHRTLVFRFDAPIFFANANYFCSQVKQRLSGDRRIDTVVIAAEPITDIDTTGAESLADLVGDLRADGVRLVFAELRGPVKDRLRRYGLYDTIGEENFFGDLEEAVAAISDQAAADLTAVPGLGELVGPDGGDGEADPHDQTTPTRAHPLDDDRPDTAPTGHPDPPDTAPTG